MDKPKYKVNVSAKYTLNIGLKKDNKIIWNTKDRKGNVIDFQIARKIVKFLFKL